MEVAQENDFAPQQLEGLERRPGREAPAAQPADAGRQGNFQRSSTTKVLIICSLSILGIYSGTFAAKNFSWLKDAPPLTTDGTTPVEPRQTIQIRYFSFHPFNLIYRMSLQTLFGLPGETEGKIPLIYSNYELKVVLRTLNKSDTSERNWTDPGSFATFEPAAAYMYTAALLTLPRITLLYAWLYDHNGAYKLVEDVGVNVMEAADVLSMGWLRKSGLLHTLVASGTASMRGQPRIGASDVAGAFCLPAAEDAAAAAATGAATSLVKLGFWLWPMALLCPGLMTSFLALAAVDTAPIAAGWVVITGIVKAACEIRVLLHCAVLVWQRRPQAAVHCLACSHGVPLMLGCHALLLLRLAGALLPARIFLYLSFYLYSTWAPLAATVIMVLALRPNNGQLLEGAMDNILHLGHRAVEELHPTANAATDNSGANSAVARRKHWPPPVAVPAELQEAAESAPKHLLCPITHHILTEPAVTSTGATYERSAIVEWLSKAGKDPLTGHTVSADDVYPNIAMYSVVEEYVREWSMNALKHF